MKYVLYWIDLSFCLFRLPAELFQDYFSMRMNKERKFSSYKTCLRSKSLIQKLSSEDTPFAAAFTCKNKVGKHCGSFFDDAREFRCFEETFGQQYPQRNTIFESNNFMDTYSKLSDALQHLRPNTDSMNVLSPHNRCISNAQKKSDICISKLEKQCKQSSIRGAKVIRMRMENVALLLKHDPEVKIIHYFRDPRGLELSRSKGMTGNKQTAMIKDAEFTCRKMRTDIQIRKQLEHTYPNNFMVLKYEDLAIDTIATAERIYQFLRMRIPTVLRDWLNASTQGSETHRAALSTAQRNGTAAAMRWRIELPAQTAQAIAGVCGDILEELGFEI